MPKILLAFTVLFEFIGIILYDVIHGRADKNLCFETALWLFCILGMIAAIAFDLM